MADTIRILVATDNHVGAHERDPNRGDDSWKTFHEIMELAKDREVDMVLLAGDLFHENKPSRKSLYNVMRSLRMNCLGARPCEIEILSDGSQAFDATFDYANYEDPDINVSIPVFSIHGNHDDPTGDGHFAALDLLAVSGLINYFGRAHESDSIEVRPVLLQKGSTKLALYGLSNVRDERLHRTFKDGKVTFYQAGAQQSDWFNLICVHQNHHPRTDTNWLPENFLPEFLDLIIWGHEHNCDIEPTVNPEMNFKVMQPGSSIATSLVPGEAIPKYVSIISITGRELKTEPIRLTTVRPFVYKDIVLAQDKVAVRISNDDDHRTKLTAHLIDIVEGMIKEAKEQWRESQAEAGLEPSQTEPPLPLIRLRVEYTAPNGLAKFEVENPQRFSNRFQGKVANTNDVIQFHIKKRTAATDRAAKDAKRDEEIMARMALDNIRVEQLVKEFLAAQSLKILPQQPFGNAVNDYVEKDDRGALDDFVATSLTKQISELGKFRDEVDDSDEGDDIVAQIQQVKDEIEKQYATQLDKVRNKKRYKPAPLGWDSDEDGPWVEQPAAVIHESKGGSADQSDESDEDGTPAPRAATRGRGRGRGARGGRGAAATTRGRGGATARGKAATATKATKTTKSRSRRQVSDDDDDDDEDEDVAMPDMDDDDDDDEVAVSDDESDSQAMFFPSNGRKTTQSSNGTATSRKAAATTTKKAAPAKATRKTLARTAAKASTGTGRQGTLNFSASQASVLGTRAGAGKNGTRDDVESIEDDSDGFEEMPSQAVFKGRRR
jgi:double-strand break repair protein MRE11